MAWIHRLTVKLDNDAGELDSADFPIILDKYDEPEMDQVNNWIETFGKLAIGDSIHIGMDYMKISQDALVVVELMRSDSDKKIIAQLAEDHGHLFS